MAEQQGTTGISLPDFRNQLAWTVFLVCYFGIVFLAYLVVSYGTATDENRRHVFAIVVPLFSTWVGTVLAFYFSKDNFESASATVRKMAEKLTPDQSLQQTSVRQAMKPKGSIKFVAIKPGKDDDSITLKELRDVLDQGNSRVPILRPEGAAKYVVHDSTIAKFIASTAGGAAPATDMKLSEMLGAKIGSEDFKTVVSKIAFVKIDASLADARDAMLAVKGAQDVFVTKTGKPDEPIEGWLTNTDFAREL